MLVKQEQQIDIDALVAGDDGMLYLLRHGDVNWHASFRGMPTEGGQPVVLSEDWIDPFFYRDHALYGFAGDSIARLQIPRSDLAARQQPVLTISNVAPPPLDRLEPVKFTSSDGAPTVASAKMETTWLVAPPPPPATVTSSATDISSRRGGPPGSSSDGRTPAPAATGSLPNEGNGSNTDASAIAGKVVDAFSGGDTSTFNSLYADTVDYLDSGRIRSDAVMRQLEEYFNNWPVRQWQIIGPVKVEALGASVQQVEFSARYDLSNPSSNRHASGTARETLVLAADSSGAMKIIAHHENTRPDRGTHSGRSERRPERQKIYKGEVVNPWLPSIPRP